MTSKFDRFSLLTNLPKAVSFAKINLSQEKDEGLAELFKLLLGAFPGEVAKVYRNGAGSTLTSLPDSDGGIAINARCETWDD